MINVISRLIGVISTENYAKRTSATSSSAITISKTDPHLSATEEYSIQGQSTVVKIDSPPFKILSYTKSLYFCITPKKIQKDSQNIIEIQGEYRTLI